jgi:hypothetical protein
MIIIAIAVGALVLALFDWITGCKVTGTDLVLHLRTPMIMLWGAFIYSVFEA